MTANKSLLTILAATLLAGNALAVQNLDAHGNEKVNNAKAKKWSQGSNPNQNNSVVNFGSKKNNSCNVNVGTTDSKKAKPGQKAPKDIVVTTKEVINVCK